MKWSGLISYAVSTAYTPGPNNLSSMSNAARTGLPKALIFNLGIYTAQVIMSLAAALFCSALSDLIPQVMTPMKVVGALYMLWLAWKTYTSKGLGEKDSGSSFFAGFLLCLLNPKYMLLLVVSLEAYIIPVYGGDLPLVCLMAVGLATIGFSAHLTWALFGGAMKKLFTSHARTVNTVLALLLVYCAVSLFL